MVIFVIRIVLILILIFLFLLILFNRRIILISVKIFFSNFFGELELIISLWRILFLTIVVIIRFSVLLFTFSYIYGVVVRNFILLYASFIFRILWLILNNNFYWIILGWDGLGVVSFLLIVFYIRSESINNGLFTMFQNRVGDLFFVFFLIGGIRIIMSTQLILYWGIVFLLVGRCVKRAQFPFNSWLLAAISAPTPISSLVHSSTLVVAGVYILLQYSYCLVDVLRILKYISLVRLVIRRFGLLNERDIKKLIAYSTINHVSLMIYLLSFKLYKVVYFHLNVHAIFKSLIFMCFGYVILLSFHGQDKRLVRLSGINPLIKIIYYFACICIMGLPFLRAFFSKDFIIEKFMDYGNEFFFIFSLLGFLRLRIFYRIKLIQLTSVQFSYQIVDKNYLRIFSVILIVCVIIVMINVFISIIFRVSLEFLSYKLRVYLGIFMFFFFRLVVHWNYKLRRFSFVHRIKEVWRWDFYKIDKFVYFRVISFVRLVSKINNIKLVFLVNWWVIIMFVVLFYNIS